MSKPILTQSRLRELFDYDPETGIVTRKLCTANRQKIGEEVGHKYKRGYLQATINYVKYPLHRLIWVLQYGVWPKGDIDHIDRDRANNRLANLRDVSRSENMQNAGVSSANWSGYTGVAWDKSKCLWVAQIKANGKQLFLGRFKDPAAASTAYQAAKLIYHPTAPVAH